MFFKKRGNSSIDSGMSSGYVTKSTGAEPWSGGQPYQQPDLPGQPDMPDPFSGGKPPKKRWGRTAAILGGGLAAAACAALAIIGIVGAHRGVDTYTSHEKFSTALADLYERWEPAAGADEPYATCRLVVSCGEDVDLTGLGAEEILQGPGGEYIVQFGDMESAEKACETLSQTEGVAFAEPDQLMTLDALPASSPALSWGTGAIGSASFAEKMAQVGYTRGVTVAVVDSGVSSGHELLSGRMTDGKDFIDGDRDPDDLNGHGTHVAGIITDAARGLDIRIMPVRIFDESGRGFSSAVGEGVSYAAANGADVINLSLGGGHSNYIDQAVEEALARNIVVVASAGNDAWNAEKNCPAHIPGAFTVSAVDENYQLASFSNYGDAVDFCAPGTGIYSSVPGGYDKMSGTSMAAPYISACAAMIKAAGLGDTVSEIRSCLMSACLDLGQGGRDALYGCGMPQMSWLTDRLDAPVPTPPPATAEPVRPTTPPATAEPVRPTMPPARPTTPPATAKPVWPTLPPIPAEPVLPIITPEPSREGTVLIVSAPLNVRASPNTDARSLEVVEVGTLLICVGESGDWYQVRYGDGIAYVFKTYAMPTDSEALSSGEVGTVTVHEDLNVRGGPGTQYARMGTVAKGEHMVYVGWTDGWCRVLFNGEPFYVSADYVTVD